MNSRSLLIALFGVSVLLTIGKLTATDGKSNKVIGTYANCDATWTYNDTAISRR